jgi:RND family efflux transporter MFP subunit
MILAASACTLAAGAALAAEPPLATAQATLEATTLERVLDGRVEAVNEATVTAQTSGQVVELLYDVGDRVPQGAVVVRLRGKEQRAVYDEALARYNQAQSDFERISEIYEKQLVSRAEFDRAEANFRAATAALERAREQTGYTEVRAPFAGVMTRRHIEVGEVAQVGQPLVSGVSLSKLRVAVDLPESLIDAVREVGLARVLLDGEDHESLRSEALTFFPYADPMTNTVRVRFNLPERKGEEPNRLVPGRFVKVAFAIGEEERLLVPAQAVVYRGEVTGVYVVSAGGEVRLRQVRLGHPAGEKIEILAGLSPGEEVALDPLSAVGYIKSAAGGSPHE